MGAHLGGLRPAPILICIETARENPNVFEGTTMFLKEPQPRVESVSLSRAMARHGEKLHHGEEPA